MLVRLEGIIHYEVLRNFLYHVLRIHASTVLFRTFLATKIGDFFRTAKRKTFFNLEKSAPVTDWWQVHSASPTLMKFPQFKLFIHSI